MPEELWEMKMEALEERECENVYDEEDYFKCCCGAEFVVFGSDRYKKIRCPVCGEEI